MPASMMHDAWLVFWLSTSQPLPGDMPSGDEGLAMRPLLDVGDIPRLKRKRGASSDIINPVPKRKRQGNEKIADKQ